MKAFLNYQVVGVVGPFLLLSSLGPIPCKAQRPPSASESKNDVQRLREEVDTLRDQLAREKLAKRDAVLKLEAENQALRSALEEERREIAELKKSQLEAIAALAISQANQKMLLGEVAEFRKMLSELLRQRDQKSTHKPPTEDPFAPRTKPQRTVPNKDPFAPGPGSPR